MSPKEKELHNLLQETRIYMDACTRQLMKAEERLSDAMSMASTAEHNIIRVCELAETLLYAIALEDSKAQPEPESEEEIDL